MEEILNGIGAGVIQLMRLGIGLLIVKMAIEIGRNGAVVKDTPKWKSITLGLFGSVVFAIVVCVILNDPSITNTGGVFGVYDYEGDPSLPSQEFWKDDIQDYVYPESTVSDYAKTLTFMFSITFFPFLYSLNKGGKINTSE